ncbi:MAG: cAMP-dependent protein kinase type II-beta regulatory subunit [Marteilia pararefringens]
MSEEDILKISQMSTNFRRTSFRGQSFDPKKLLNKVKSIKTHPKTQETKDTLLQQFQDIVFISKLDEESKNLIVDAMHLKEVKKGDVIIKEGDQGDNFYVIECGAYSITQFNKKTKKIEEVCKLTDKGYFGELSLLYDTMRNATVTVESETGKLWSLSSECFKTFICSRNYQIRLTKLNQLKKMGLFQEFSEKKLDTLTDAMNYQTIVGSGTIIFHQGDDPDALYFIVEGSVQCRKSINGSDKTLYCECDAGDYFGELALVNRCKRAATVVTLSDKVVLMKLLACDFHRLIGFCIEAIMKKASLYAES